MKEISWRGRFWTIRPATESERELHMRDKSGQVFEQRATIIYDDTVDEDLQIMTILHELGHVMFPEWEAEPVDTSKSELGVLERDLKAILEECGVDLTPLVRDDEEE